MERREVKLPYPGIGSPGRIPSSIPNTRACSAACFQASAEVAVGWLILRQLGSRVRKIRAPFGTIIEFGDDPD